MSLCYRFYILNGAITQSKTTFSITTPSIMEFTIRTVSILTLSMTTLSLVDKIATLVLILFFTVFKVMLTVIMLDVSMPCTVMFSVVALMRRNQNRYTKLNETFSVSRILTVVIEGLSTVGRVDLGPMLYNFYFRNLQMLLLTQRFLSLTDLSSLV
jgi:hypothetical protein